MVRLEQKFQQHSQVVATELDPKEAVLLHLDTKRYYNILIYLLLIDSIT